MIRRGLIVSRRSVAQRALFAASKSAFSLKSTKSAANGAKRAFSMTSARMLPTHELVNLPALSPTMETGTIKQWELNVGDEFEEGDVLCEVETDKAVVAFEAVGLEGFIAKILTPDGTKDIQVGALVCIVVENKEDVASFANYKVGDSTGSTAPISAEAPVSAPAPPVAAQPAAVASKFPDYEVVTLPALSPTMETGSIVEWQIEVGSEVIDGDTLIAEIETDKATIAFEATGMEGFVAKIFRDAGEKDIKLGDPLFILVEEKEMVDKFKDFSMADLSAVPVKSVGGAVAVEAPTQISTPANIQPESILTSTGERVFISPFAKKIAEEQGINFQQIPGTGPAGRIRANDVKNFKPVAAAPVAAPVAKAAPAPKAQQSIATSAGPSEYTDIDLTNMRKTIAKRLLESKNSIPHYYLTRTIQMDNIMALRKELNQISDTKISINDFIIKASSLALLKHPEVNSAWMGDVIRQYNVVDMSVAVATPNGLLTPIIFDSHAKGLAQISTDMKSLAAKARDGKLQPNEFVGGTFTISNLGMMGIDHFTAIINPPQSAILAVGASTQKLVQDDSDKGFKSVTEMKVTMSCDHRTVDGAVGAQWLKTFAAFLENPITMHL